MSETQMLCGHWLKDQRRYCGSTRAVQQYRTGFRCAEHTGPPLPPQLRSAETSGEHPRARRDPQAEQWRHATVTTWADAAPCVLCGGPAMLRDPDTRRPMHKVCSEQRRGADGIRQEAA